MLNLETGFLVYFLVRLLNFGRNPVSLPPRLIIIHPFRRGGFNQKLGHKPINFLFMSAKRKPAPTPACHCDRREAIAKTSKIMRLLHSTAFRSQ
jgi:hypothetical protein